MPWRQETIASRSPCSATTASHIAPIVSSRSGVSERPCEYERRVAPDIVANDIHVFKRRIRIHR